MPFWKKKPSEQKYKTMPDRGVSYVVDDNGEPMLVYYRKNSGLFCNTPVNETDIPHFLNIRRPVVFDVENMTQIDIPNDLPPECDGIVFLNYGTHKIKAFYVRNLNEQVMRLG